MPAATPEIPTVDERSLCGWRVTGTLPLPDLAPWRGEARGADLTVDLGPVPARLEDTVVDRPLLQVGADGRCRFQVPGVAGYLVDPGGGRVVVAPVLPPEAPDIRVFLLGTVLAILCFRRGLLPLHASCVRVGDRAIALAGPSGLGKSTLAAALLRRGHAVLADDVTVLDVTAPDGPRVLPAFPRLTLRRDAAERLGIPVDRLERGRARLDTYHLPLGDAFRAEPLPLSAVFHLETDVRSEGVPPRRLRGPEAVARVGRDVYRAGLMRRLGLAGRLLPAAAAVAGVDGGTFALAQGHGPGGLERGIDAILERAGA